MCIRDSSLSIPFKNVELTSEAKDLSVKPESVVLEQGYYWCQIVHEYHPALGSGQEFCIAVLSDKAEAPDINSYLDLNVTCLLYTSTRQQGGQ